jgi:glycosyltransferase involved in cell wall biosynthesis
MAPTVSIILPTHNRRHVLPRAIASICGQTFTDFEAIVIDDGSTDDTRQFLSEIDDPRIVPVILEANAGACAARNVGLARARGEFVTFLDSDDEFHPEKLERQVKRFRENPHGLDNLGAVLGVTLNRRDPALVVMSNARNRWTGDVSELIWEHPGHTWSTFMVKREYLEHVGGFDTRLKASDFWDLSMRLAEVCQFDGTDRSITILHHDAEPRSWNLDYRVEAAKVLLEKFDFSPSCRHRARASFHMTIAKGALEQKRTFAMLWQVLRAVRAHPNPMFTAKSLKGLVRGKD